MSSVTRMTGSSDLIPLEQKVAYAAGMLVNNLQAAAIPAMMIVLNLGIGLDPRLVGIIGFIPRIFDAVSDPLMGYISDNTRSPWGRRRPYIFLGAIISGLVFAGIWQFPDGHTKTFYFWFFLLGSILYFLTYTVYATPFGRCRSEHDFMLLPIRRDSWPGLGRHGFGGSCRVLKIRFMARVF